jgi:hypothetical protein
MEVFLFKISTLVVISLFDGGCCGFLEDEKNDANIDDDFGFVIIGGTSVLISLSGFLEDENIELKKPEFGFVSFTFATEEETMGDTKGTLLSLTFNGKDDVYVFTGVEICEILGILILSTGLEDETYNAELAKNIE